MASSSQEYSAERFAQYAKSMIGNGTGSVCAGSPMVSTTIASSGSAIPARG